MTSEIYGVKLEMETINNEVQKLNGSLQAVINATEDLVYQKFHPQ